MLIRSYPAVLFDKPPNLHLPSPPHPVFPPHFVLCFIRPGASSAFHVPQASRPPHIGASTCPLSRPARLRAGSWELRVTYLASPPLSNRVASATLEVFVPPPTLLAGGVRWCPSCPDCVAGVACPPCIQSGRCVRVRLPMFPRIFLIHFFVGRPG